MKLQIRRRLSDRTTRRAAVVGAAGLFVISVGVGIASATPGDGGQIAACYQNSSGAMRAVDAGELCKKNETRLLWSSGPAALAAGSVVGGPGGVVLDGSLSKDDLGSDSVESDELANGSVDTAHLADGAVKGGLGGVVLDGGITVYDLAADSVNGSKIKDGTVGTDDLSDDAVTTGKIENGAIGTGDLANGAATTDKLTANLQGATGGPVSFTSPGVETKPVSSATLTTSPNHKLLVLGQTQLTCTPCGAADSVSVKWQVFEGGTPVGQEYQSVLSSTAATTPANVSALIPNSGAAGAHTYQLRVTVSNGFATTVTSTNDSLSVVDLGQ
jgi:hypothetical protein